MPKGFIPKFYEAIEEAALLYEQAKSLAALMKVLRDQFQMHPNYSILFEECERMRSKEYQDMMTLVQRLLDSSYVRGVEPDDISL